MRPTQIKGQQTKDSSITLDKLANDVIAEMQDVVVSELHDAPIETTLHQNDWIPVVHGGVLHKITVQDLKAWILTP